VALPYLTADVPGTGGRLRDACEDFVVEEIPAYEASGAGEHVFAWIEKRDVTTPVAAASLAAAVGARARDVGWAGLKDKRSIARQWLSLPPPVTPEQVLAAKVDGVTVLEARRHGNKLKTGHLRGNRFVLRVRGVRNPDDAAARAARVLGALSEPPGALNWYGEQRFGKGGENAARGRAVLDGSLRVHDKEKRLLVSALQSELFNEWLRRRVADGLVRRVIEGDWLEKRATGGSFSTTDPAVDLGRVAAGEIVVTGPMFGWKLRGSPAGTEAAAREEAVLADAGLTLASFRPAGDLALGTRRPLAIAITDASVTVVPPVTDGSVTRGSAPSGDDAIDVRFTLPSGAYATAVMREIMKPETDPC
jgi:tRNA pseudouridine13 synthase